jgi:Rap1a immunity proteins
MMNYVSLIVAVLGCAAAGAAAAQEDEDFFVQTAGDLAGLCAVDPGEARYAAAIHMCQGFLVGVHQFHTAMHADGSQGIYCLPESNPPTRNEAAEGFSAWVMQTPDVVGLPAVEGLVRWAAARFPCE